jgi:hypothetical protein
MKKRLAQAAIATVLIASLFGGGSTAGAAVGSKAQAQVLGTVVTGAAGTASVTARYICPEGFHLWLSAKQSADGQPDQRLRGEGSSALSAAWFESHPTSFTCDGKWHTQTFEITNAEQGFGHLRPGQAWVQFCLIGEQTFISESRWVAVQ